MARSIIKFRRGTRARLQQLDPNSVEEGELIIVVDKKNPGIFTKDNAGELVELATKGKTINGGTFGDTFDPVVDTRVNGGTF